MINLRQHTHSHRGVFKLTGHKKKIFEQGTLLTLFCVLYLDDVAFIFEDRDQLTRGLNLVYQHFTRFGLKMHVGRGKKAYETECVFFPPPRFFRRKLNLPTKNGKRKRIMLVINTIQESYDSRQKREEITYNNLPETRLIVVKDGFVTFCRHFNYLGSWISFSLQEDHGIAKRLAAANALMGSMSNIWDNDHVDTYSKYLLFRAIPCNLLLWGFKSW